MPRPVLASLCVLLAASLPHAAAATEYCVSCAAPDATYRCAVADAPEGTGADARAQLLCIKQLAETGGHESCSVMRKAAVPCDGTLTVIAAPLTEQALPAPPPELAAPHAPDPADEPATDAAADEEKKVPQTMEELAGQTVQSSKEGLKKAGDAIAGTAEKTGEQIGNAGNAVANAAKKTWNCLASLFSDC